MKHRVLVSDAAESDVFEIVEHILLRESALAPGLAVQARLERAIVSLSENPKRGRIVPSLKRLGIGQFRELVEAPWRIVYSIREATVHVVAVLDGRRSAEDLLRERALRDL